MITKTQFKDFLTFRYMVTPSLIQFLFWIGILACLITTLTDWLKGQFWQGLIVLIIGPLLVRIASEILMVFFQINNALWQIWHMLEKR